MKRRVLALTYRVFLDRGGKGRQFKLLGLPSNDNKPLSYPAAR